MTATLTRAEKLGVLDVAARTALVLAMAYYGAPKWFVFGFAVWTLVAVIEVVVRLRRGRPGPQS